MPGTLLPALLLLPLLPAASALRLTGPGVDELWSEELSHGGEGGLRPVRLWDGRHGLLDAAPSMAVRLARTGEVPAEEAADPGQRRIAVCLTGQMARLEVESKLQNLLPVLGLFYHVEAVDLFVVLELHSHRFTSKVTEQNSTPECRQDPYTPEGLKAKLAPYYRSGLYVEHEDLEGEVNLENWPAYGTMDRDAVKVEVKRNMLESDAKAEGDRRVRQRMAGHLAQFTHEASCAELIKRQESQLGGQKYTDVLRIREDGIVVAPFPWKQRASLATKCSEAWGGINDKVLQLPRQHLDAAFTGPLALMRAANAGDASAVQRVCHVENTEQVLGLAVEGLPKEFLSPEDMPIVAGRCATPWRDFCLLVSRDEAPRTPGLRLFAPPCPGKAIHSECNKL